jgi:hypothetical protein
LEELLQVLQMRDLPNLSQCKRKGADQEQLES